MEVFQWIRWTLPKELAIGSTVYSCTFLKGINCDESCPRRLSAWPSLLTARPGTFLLYQSQCVSTPWTVFSTQTHNDKPMFRPFVNISFNKTCFSIHITYSSENLTWFELPSHQKFDDRPVFKPATILNSLKINTFVKIK